MRFLLTSILIIISLSSYSQTIAERQELLPKAFEAAKSGNSEAEYFLAYEYLQGEIIDKNVDEAVKWLNQATSHGNQKAAELLVWCYLNGDIVEKNDQRAFEIAKSFSDNNNIWGISTIGMFYGEGIGCEKNDYLAFKYSKQAADAEYAPAQYSVGLYYLYGIGVEDDKAQAILYLKKAAENGVGGACNVLGNIYTKDGNEKESYRLYRQGAQIGDALAMCNLSQCYVKGQGTDPDLKKAIEWAEKATVNHFSGGYAALAAIYATKSMFDPDKALKNINSAINGLEQDNLNIYSEDVNKVLLSYLNLKGKILLQRGDQENAKQVAKEIVMINPQFEDNDDNSLMDFYWNRNTIKNGDKNISNIILSDVDTVIPQRNKGVADNTFAIIIGNEHYTDVQDVEFANHDAEIFAEYCQKVLEIPSKNIRLYLDATYGKMLASIEDIQAIAKAYNNDVNIIFYYAGHGIPSDKTKLSLLLPVDNNGRNDALTIPINALIQDLSQTMANQIIILLDACFSGANRGDGMLSASRGINIKPQPEEPKGNMIIFSATNEDETAHPYYDKSHGLFTYFILKKIQETTGNVSLGDIVDDVTENVGRSSIVLNGKPQTPTIAISPELKESWRNIDLSK